MNDTAQVLVPLDHGEHPVAVGDVQLGKFKAGKGAQPGEPRLLETHIIIFIEIVDADYPLAPLEQCVGDMKTDEPGSAGDKDRHHAPLERRIVRARLNCRAQSSKRNARRGCWTVCHSIGSHRVAKLSFKRLRPAMKSNTTPPDRQEVGDDPRALTTVDIVEPALVSIDAIA